MHALIGFARAGNAWLMVWLVQHGVPFVMAGTFALAGIGAAIVNPASAGPDRPGVQSSSTPNYYLSAHHCHHGGNDLSGH